MICSIKISIIFELRSKRSVIVVAIIRVVVVTISATAVLGIVVPATTTQNTVRALQSILFEISIVVN